MAINRKKGLAALSKVINDGGMYVLAEQKPLEVESTGIATLDAALGTGGFVRGSQNIIYGAPSAGKSALAYNAIAALQRKDPEARACILDVERSANKDWLEKFGVDVSRVHIVQEETIEQAVNAFQEVMRANVFDYVLVDSLGAVIRQVSFDGKDGKGGDASVRQVGGSSGVITDWVNKANGELTVLDKIENTGQEVIKPIIIYINQVRDVIGARIPMQTMSGGNALRHMAGTIIKLKASGAASDKMWGFVDEGEKVQVGTRVSCVIEKNKYAPARRMAGYNFCYEDCPEYPFGVDNVDACLSLAIERHVIDAAGPWLSFGKDIRVQGKSAMRELMVDNPEFFDTIYAQVMDTYTQEVQDARGTSKSEQEQ